MGATVFKQPNGLYGRYSYVCDDFTDVNMTKDLKKCTMATSNMNQMTMKLSIKLMDLE